MTIDRLIEGGVLSGYVPSRVQCSSAISARHVIMLFFRPPVARSNVQRARQLYPERQVQLVQNGLLWLENSFLSEPNSRTSDHKKIIGLFSRNKAE